MCAIERAVMDAYDKTSIQINRCKRILALVDTYVETETASARTDLRKALMEEFEAPAIAPLEAAGSVDRPKLHDMTLADTETRDWYFDCDGHYIDVELRKDGHYSIYFRNRANGGKGWLDTWVLHERAEKAEADLKQVNEWRNAALQENMRLADVWMDRVTRSEARVKELEERIEELETEIKVLHLG